MFSVLKGERKALSYSLVLYALVLFVLFNIKPSFSFNEEGEMKQWGIGKEKTMFPVYVVAMLISIVGLCFMSIMYS